MAESKIIVALDYPNAAAADATVRRLSPQRCHLKVGLELYSAAGPDFVRALTARGFNVFLDLKFHDIPNTVAQACRQAAALGVWMLTVHCAGGAEMLRAARASVMDAKLRPRIVGVTVLTSLSSEQLQTVGVAEGVESHVLRLARLAADNGLDGVVAAPTEAAFLRAQFATPFLIVTPGIRLRGDSSDDQRRIMTPADAARAGADYLVVGRPVTRAADPAAVVAEIESQLGTA